MCKTLTSMCSGLHTHTSCCTSGSCTSTGDQRGDCSSSIISISSCSSSCSCCCSGILHLLICKHTSILINSQKGNSNYSVHSKEITGIHVWAMCVHGCGWNRYIYYLSHSDNVPLTWCHEPPVALFNIITRSPVHGGSDTVNFTGRRVIDYAHPHLIHGTVNGTPCNDIEWSNGRFVAPCKRDVIAVSTCGTVTPISHYYAWV